MKIGPKYKIARKLKAHIFEKTQTQKYAIRSEKRGKVKFKKPQSEFGFQLNEKQEARLVYGLSERQFSNYVKEALSKKSTQATQKIFENLESRLDNESINKKYKLIIIPTQLKTRRKRTAKRIGIMCLNGINLHSTRGLKKMPVY